MNIKVSVDFQPLIDAIKELPPVDFGDLTAEIKRMADAQYVGTGANQKSITQVTVEGNSQVDSVIAADSTGQMRVQVNPEVP